ncbi:MAG TPA: hypothetical protein DCY13_18225 [Verrucomicrobiales bacterium]|nr:hypothetical protein [Verrucomicrobiales bacterium]
MSAAYVGEFIVGTFLVLFLVLLNGFFVAAEFAIVKIRDTQLTGLVKKGNRRARIAQHLLHNLDAALSATQLGITLASLGLGWFAEPIFARLLDPLMTLVGMESEHLRHTVSFAIGFSVITFLHIVAGELAPKSLAIQKPLPTTLWIAAPLKWFYYLSYPFIWALNNTALYLLRSLGIQPASESELVHSKEELRLLISHPPRTGDDSSFGRGLVLNAFDLGERMAREVMRPRQEIVGLSTSASISECVEIARQSRFSRFPLCEHGDLDRTLGVVHIKDLFSLQNKAQSGADLSRVAHRLIYIPETARLERVLQFFLERKTHFAIVVDEYGGTVGMVTLENVLEELVGQIQDEFDQEKPLAQELGDGVWELDGSLPLHELAELTSEFIYSEGISTTSGWVTERLGGFAKVGDVVPLERHEIRVQSMDGLRVARVKVSRVVDPGRSA